MNGKELKALAATLSDDCNVVVSMPHPSRNLWESNVIGHELLHHGGKAALVLYPANADYRPIIGAAQ